MDLLWAIVIAVTGYVIAKQLLAVYRVRRHCTAGEIEAYLRRDPSFSEEEHRRMTAHLGTCARCRDLMDDVIGGASVAE